MIKLFSREWYSTVLDVLDEYEIIHPVRKWSYSQNKWVHSYIPQEMAEELARSRGINEPDIYGTCKKYKMNPNIELDATVNGFESITVNLKPHSKTYHMLKDFYTYSDLNDNPALQSLFNSSKKITLDLPEKEIKKRENFTAYNNVKNCDTRIYKKRLIDNRIITDHCHIKKSHLRHFKTNTGENVSFYDIRSSMATYTLLQLKQRDDLPTNYTLFNHLENGNIYEHLQDLIFKKFSNDEIESTLDKSLANLIDEDEHDYKYRELAHIRKCIYHPKDHLNDTLFKKFLRNTVKEAFMTLAYRSHYTHHWKGTIVNQLHQVIDSKYPEWIVTLKSLNTAKRFKLVFGDRLHQVEKDKSYIYYLYTQWESQYILSLLSMIYTKYPSIPLATRYDSIIVPESMQLEIFSIICQLNISLYGSAQAVPFKQETFN
ncbi:hypothetical protein [Rhodohalobacter barkolensis]|uniref:Uncharacterized protein n=1 Tax=Rhodohalobacter barkolensis TaxID=2053187 RepID=A0A2N0VH06_9BACT|nr:hypothetical protein [Rhodohalobacter barkolensis]PKD43477.1 hypothetical protein CWD77_07855 [Rhodohalobacter barkolensis]